MKNSWEDTALSQGRFLILVVMNRTPAELTSPSVLAEKIGVTRATMTRLIDGLERDGLIRRYPHGEDRRRQNIKLTAKGQELLEEILPDYWSRIDTLMKGLNETEQQAMITLLSKVADGLPALTEEGNSRSAPDPVEIREFQPGQTQGVIDLILPIQQGEFGIPISAEDQPDLADICGVYQRGCGNFWVACHKTCVVGTVALIDVGNHQAALRKMFVHRAFRGREKGTAKRLLQTLLDWARHNHIQEIFLGTTPRFLAAHRFYEKTGFEEIIKEDLPAAFPLMTVDTKFYRYRV